IRAAFPLSSGVSIVLMTPNTSNQIVSGTEYATPLWHEEAQKVVRRAARDYGCAFIDTYGLFQSAEDSANKWLDEYALHPTAPYNWMLGSVIYDLLFPS